MRKQYVSIQDMGTSKQNSWNQSNTPNIPIFSKGRTSIDTIEDRTNYSSSSSQDISKNHEMNKYIQPVVNTNSCYDSASHMSSCPLCQKLFNNDPIIYIMIIAILVSIIIILIMKRT